LKPTMNQIHDLLEEKASRQFVTNLNNQKVGKDDLNKALDDNLTWAKSEITKISSQVNYKVDHDQFNRLER
jgi:hypothetical protein